MGFFARPTLPEQNSSSTEEAQGLSEGTQDTRMQRLSKCFFLKELKVFPLLIKNMFLSNLLYFSDFKFN